MEKKILRNDKFWRIEVVHRKTDNILSIKCIGKTKDNKDNSRIIMLDVREQVGLKRFLEDVLRYYISIRLDIMGDGVK